MLSNNNESHHLYVVIDAIKANWKSSKKKLKELVLKHTFSFLQRYPMNLDKIKKENWHDKITQSML